MQFSPTQIDDTQNRVISTFRFQNSEMGRGIACDFSDALREHCTDQNSIATDEVHDPIANADKIDVRCSAPANRSGYAPRHRQIVTQPMWRAVYQAAMMLVQVVLHLSGVLH